MLEVQRLVSTVADELERERDALVSLITLLETALEDNGPAPIATALGLWYEEIGWRVRRPLERTLALRLLTAARSYRGTVENVLAKARA